MAPAMNRPLLDPGLCRCCRSIKKCRILTSTYKWMDQKEVYAEMIMDCFGILLSHTDSTDKDNAICATCVTRLRDAIEFRKQVLQCEEMFLHSKIEQKDVDFEYLQSVEKKLRSKLKADEDIKKIDCDDNKMDFDSLLTTDKIIGKEESKSLKGDQAGLPDLQEDHILDFDSDNYLNEGSIPPKPSKDAPKPELQPEPSDDDDDLPLILKAKKTIKTKKKVKTKLVKKKKKKLAKKVVSDQEPPPIRKDTTERDLDYMAEENLLTIIDYSFACPFKNRRNNYYCFYCKEYFPKPEDLRQHTVSHDTKPFQLLLGYKKMPKLDITRIDCRLCNAKIGDLNSFKYHIDTVHGKKVYKDAPDKMLLYKLTWNNLVCVTCSEVFEDFNSLNAHMVKHFSNFTCDVCGMNFLEKSRLDAHIKRHKDNEKHTCEICGKIFKSNHYKDMHVDIVHRKKAIIRCPKCDESFLSYALKNKHLTEVHGQKRMYPCNLCDKVYNRQKTLTEHHRRNHQKVMKHQCQYCEQRFYLPSRLKEHLATHTGERNFRCEYCDKCYPRLKSLQYHVRTHTNDRRYRCHVCGQAFIMNASLKTHIKSQHPECDMEACYF